MLATTLALLIGMSASQPSAGDEWSRVLTLSRTPWRDANEVVLSTIGYPFRITSVEPSILTGWVDVNSTEHHLQLDFQAWIAASRPSIVSLATDLGIRRFVHIAAPPLDPIAFDPPEYDFGEMQAGRAQTGKVRIWNLTTTPITVVRAVAGGGPTPSWPRSPIQPGEFGESEFTIRPGDKQGIELHKKITFQIESHSPVIYTLKPHVKEFIRVEPFILTAVEVPTQRVVELRVDWTEPFTITSVDPPVWIEENRGARQQHRPYLDVEAWNALAPDTSIRIATDRPDVDITAEVGEYSVAR